MNQIVTIICTVGAFLLLLLIGYLRMRGNVKEWLLWAVTQAEQYLGSGTEESRQAQSYYKHQLKMIGIDPILLGAEEIPLREVKDIPWFYTSKVPMLHLHLPKAEGAEKAVCKAVQDYFRE